MDFGTFDTKLREVIDRLKSNGFREEAAELEALCAMVKQGGMAAAEALIGIRNRCHIKWLGDLQVEGIGYQNWLTG